jgi:DNA polymerase mu
MYTEHTPADSEREHNGIADQGFGVDCLDKAYTIVKGPSGKFRQVDIVVCPIQVYGCAVVGWSGSTMFERSIREYSGRELGLQFQSWGIFRKDNGERIECRDERDVFTIFNLPYIPPEMRWDYCCDCL